MTASVMTIEDVNKRIPLLSKIATDIKQVVSLIKYMQSDSDNKSIAVTERRKRLVSQLSVRLKKYGDEIKDLGGSISSYSKGVVTFKTKVNGYDAFLVWRFNDNNVGYWYYKAEGQAIMRKITS
jgi:hypothetical protein